jgi:hypothetical protein
MNVAPLLQKSAHVATNRPMKILLGRDTKAQKYAQLID